MLKNTDYNGNDIKSLNETEVTGSSMECGAKCAAEPNCKYWTWLKDNYPNPTHRGKCLLKTAKGNEQALNWGISGSKTCPLQSGN